MHRSVRYHAFALLCLAGLSGPAFAQPAAEDDAPADSTTSATIQVTATRVPEAVDPVPASISIITGVELEKRNVHTLAGALALVGGVSVAPGGDGGPASSVPEMWGLREFDAFLLVVDGVPWGGAFNPALATLDLTNVLRIEVMRGAAPVMYGATSFVGVIQVIHNAAGEGVRGVEVWAGSYSSGGAAATLPLPSAGAWHQTLAANGEKQGFKDDRTEFQRGHVLYRGQGEMLGGNLHFDADLAIVKQDPASPTPREGRQLSDRVPLDANHNPSDGKIDQTRLHFVGGYDRKLGESDWTTILSVSKTDGDIVRGFLHDLDAEEDNTAGFRQDLSLTDVYFDTHFALRPTETLQVVAGADYLYGKGDVHGANFDYFVNLDGSGAPDSHSVPVQEFPSTKDERNFAGLYVQGEWKPAPRWNVQLGVRFNSTHEKRTGEVGEGAAGESEPETSATRNVSRGSGTAGVSFLLWDAAPDSLWIYADARSAFKPAAIDFGPEGEGDILKPEHGTSYEAGLKGRHFDGRFTWDVSFFQMDLTNVVTSNLVDGLPELVNTGKQRFKGYELEAAFRPLADLVFNAAYSHHEPKFRDFVQLFDDVPTQLNGKQLEMAPEELAGLGVLWAPAEGFNASATWNFVGERFLNKRNTALAKEFSTWNAGLGYRFSRYEVRVDGTNLGDARDPIAESELGDAQYYRMPARAYRLTFRAGF